MHRTPLDVTKPLVIRKAGVTLPTGDAGHPYRNAEIGEVLDWKAAGFTERQVRLMFEAWQIDVVGSPTAPPAVGPAKLEKGEAAPPAPAQPAKRPARAAGA